MFLDENRVVVHITFLVIRGGKKDECIMHSMWKRWEVTVSSLYSVAFLEYGDYVSLFPVKGKCSFTERRVEYICDI